MAAPSLRVRKLADRSSGERVTRYDPESGQAYQADPSTWRRDDPETWVETPWPFAGLVVEEAPKTCEIPTSFVARGLAEGWLTLEGHRMVHRSGGPPEAPWSVTHTFMHGEAIVLHTLSGDVRYRITANPDKWPASKNERDEGFGGDVRWFYEVKLER
ncbi:MAG TPA: hypothetical protein VI540_07085 [Gaiellaceae bacterium]|nr:hypothetical protein [Gaiellaceae bacterium]